MNGTSCHYIYPSIYVYLRISNDVDPWNILEQDNVRLFRLSEASTCLSQLWLSYPAMYPYIVNCELIAGGCIGIKNNQHFHWLLHSDATILLRGFIFRFYYKLNLECWSLNPLPPKLNRLSFFLTSHFWGLPLATMSYGKLRYDHGLV